MAVIDNVSASDVPPHLRGNGAPVQEELTLTDLRVTGTIPAPLVGRYLRNGANPIAGMRDPPFLGDGMIHGVRLREGKAEWYRNRYVQTPYITDPTRNILDMDTGLGDMAMSKANTHIFGHAGKFLALAAHYVGTFRSYGHDRAVRAPDSIGVVAHRITRGSIAIAVRTPAPTADQPRNLADVGLRAVFVCGWSRLPDQPDRSVDGKT